MKKLLNILAILGMLTFVACGGGEEKPADNTDNTEAEANTDDAATTGDTETDPEIEEVFDKLGDETAAEGKDHVCNDKCTAEACHTVCGEKGHTCSDACHASAEDDDHAGHGHS